MNNQALRRLYLKTGIITALIAAMVALGGSFDWAASFAGAGLFGLISWYLSGLALIAWTQKRVVMTLLYLGAKFYLLFMLIMVVLPQVEFRVSSFLCGFNMLLIVAMLEAVGGHLVVKLKQQPSSRPLPSDLRTLVAGPDSDG